MTLGERLTELMKEHDLTAEALAKQIGLSGSIVRRWRRQNIPLKMEHLFRVAEFFDCSLEFLCGRNESDAPFNKSVPHSFPQRLRLLINESKTPVIQISKATQLDRRNFYDWMNGEPPVSSSLIALADYFECTIDYLVGLES